MRTFATALIVLGLAACGGGDDDSAVPEQNVADDGGGGAIVNRQPAGQALVSVEGQDYMMQEPGALACSISDESITFSFRIGDNEVTLGAGANLYDTGWLGNISMTVANPTTEPGPIIYLPDLAANSDSLVVDGDSASYSGPMRKQPRNDGSNPPPVDVGDGIISVTCP
jgi:hypothetical protein